MFVVSGEHGRNVGASSEERRRDPACRNTSDISCAINTRKGSFFVVIYRLALITASFISASALEKLVPILRPRFITTKSFPNDPPSE